MAIPTSKTARQARIVDLLSTHRVRSQAELAQLLVDDGVRVTQATLSRDLVEVGAERVRDEKSGLIYTVPHSPVRRSSSEGADSRMVALFKELLITAEVSANLVLLRTPPGAAQFLAASIDQAALPPILGTVAGDDTVLVISRDPLGGEDLAQKFLSWAA